MFERLPVGALLLALLWSPQSVAETDDLSLKERELDQVRGRIEALRSELGEAQTQFDGLSEELRNAEREIGRLARRLRVLAGSIGRRQERLRQLHEQRQAQEETLALHREVLKKQIRAAYAMGRQERLKILLNQQDPASLSRALVYYDYFNRARAEQLELIEALTAQLRTTEAEVAGERDELVSLETRKKEQKERLVQVSLVRRRMAETLNQKIRNKGQELNSLVRDEQRLHSLMTQLRRELPELPTETVSSEPFRSLKGRLPWPAGGRLSARFGTPKGAGLKWDGVLISAPEGKEVRAIHYGRVAFADWLRGFGLLLIIDHGDGYMTLYGHNQSLFKETGEWVQAGEAVALVGNSGGKLDAGVYFGIRHDGRPINPKSWCMPVKGNRIGKRTDGHRMPITAVTAARQRDEA